MATIDSVRRKVQKAYKKLHNWRRVGDELGISEGLAWRLANEDGYEPKDPHIRVRLGLPALAPAPVCGRCGEVHVAKRCTRRGFAVRPYRSLWDWPVDELKRAMEKREEWDTDERG